MLSNRYQLKRSCAESVKQQRGDHPFTNTRNSFSEISKRDIAHFVCLLELIGKAESKAFNRFLHITRPRGNVCHADSFAVKRRIQSRAKL